MIRRARVEVEIMVRVEVGVGGRVRVRAGGSAGLGVEHLGHGLEHKRDHDPHAAELGDEPQRPQHAQHAQRTHLVRFAAVSEGSANQVRGEPC